MADTTWRVTHQASDQSTITDAGQPVTGVRVYFITGRANRGSVLIPDDQYANPDTVAQMIDIMARQMDYVSDLTDASVSQGP